VTPLERRYGWLLHAYPAWYRRERAGEMLGTLMEVSPPSQKWPPVREAQALVIGGLRVRGMLVWCLSILWAGLGAAGAGYLFFLSTHRPAIPTCSRIPCWAGEPGVIIAAGELGATAWLLLTIPVLVAGLVRLGNSWRSGAWTGAWLAGILLMIPVADWQPSAPAVWACSKSQGCALAGYRYTAVSWAELEIFAAWLVLGAVMILTLARARAPRRSQSDAPCAATGGRETAV
jgi:hypothetical protein